MSIHKCLIPTCLFILFLNPIGFTDEKPAYPQPDPPEFWKSTYDDVLTSIETLETGQAELIATSPGGRKVYLVSYGEKIQFAHQANYNSAVAARDPGYYARKPEGAPPTVFIIGPVHGHEVEGVVGLVNLLQIAETGRDYRGKAWPELQEKISKCRLLVIPLSNPDGRERCPYDSWVGIPVNEMTRWGQGTQKDGTLYGWPGAKKVHPMEGDVGILGAYFNDDGINFMHDEWFNPMAKETQAILDVARLNAPDYVINLHSHGSNPMILKSAYVPWYCKELGEQFGARLMERYKKNDLPAGSAPQPVIDGKNYPPPSFNLTSALHHVCGAVSILFECPHGVKEDRYPQVNHSQILDIQLILYDELLAFALDYPRPRPMENTDSSK